ncbi:hypothetical protein [Methanosphaera sp. WGK6]|uniref:hypothetical protein n=1 Tax=Methanosphaera sp. WGK6 TaxID=1561964 RepID=UPI00084C6A5B|nr:hypothetical protein [Methanosphaera sp. WGK6]OED30346.1 hypothetical protein NL43_02920 [Methanosphaera sp. WGK6]
MFLHSIWEMQKELTNHKEYIPEIIEYLKQYPDELNLYDLLLDYDDVCFKEDNEELSDMINDFLYTDYYQGYLMKQRVASKRGELILPKDYPKWFVSKFPQWRDLFIY